MEFRKNTAIVRTNLLECIEQRLSQAGVKGISVSIVKGYGEYGNFFRKDWMTTHSKIEIFTTEDKRENTVLSLMKCAYTGNPGDGIIAVEPVDEVYRIRNKALANAEEL